MVLTNQKIYEYANSLGVFNGFNPKLPVKISFFMQKNIKLITEAANEINEARLSIARTYGIYSEENDSYIIPPDVIPTAQAELNDLFNIEQDLNIHIFKLDEFENIELTYQQLSAIMFMIEE